MANSIIEPKVNSRRVGLRDLVGELILSDVAMQRNKPAVETLDNTVLLMDEVDVFFTKDFYGNDYHPVATPVLPGLDKIQTQIWNIVTNKYKNVESIKTRIHEFIKSSEFPDQEKFEQFLNKRTEYKLLVSNNGKLEQKSHTNQSMFEDHLKEMIECAIDVYSKPLSYETKYKLSARETITYQHNGQFVNTIRNRYYMTFNYFRLKKSDFVTARNGELNYGYLNVECGSISYAMLPKNYPLILGVTGTLTSLNDHEKATMKELYGINRSSIMPTFFGCSNFQFNHKAHFRHCFSRHDWKRFIFTSINAELRSNRAVLVFFETEGELIEFNAEHAGKFDRLNVLTENTEPEQKERIVNEAGVAKTVTLATRGMGRGVDYKSSVAVEKNGGVHVIQTFFSLDVKEETQIKGRTARKDNKGSYELIVCDCDLVAKGLKKTDSQTSYPYERLDALRTMLSLQENSNIAEIIKEAKGDHETTMKYMKSFF